MGTNSSKNYKIASVHLLGAAVDDEEVSKNPKDVLDDFTNWGTTKSDYGLAIEKVVDQFYNLFNPEDNVFEPNPKYPYSPAQIYPSFEGDLALGFKGSQPLISLPKNYNQTNVQFEIKNIHDADGIDGEDFNLCNSTIEKFKEFGCKVKYDGWDVGLCNFLILSCSDPPAIGDNHGGYIGFRNLNTNKSLLVDDGAMNIVVDNWKNK